MTATSNLQSKGVGTGDGHGKGHSLLDEGVHFELVELPVGHFPGKHLPENDAVAPNVGGNGDALLLVDQLGTASCRKGRGQTSSRQPCLPTWEPWSSV